MVDLLALYDAQLRTAAEVQGALDIHRLGPLWIARLGGGRLFVTYDDLDDPAARVAQVAAMLSDDDSIQRAEWKTRAHDHAPGLDTALSSAGFTAGETESVMLGEASALTAREAPVGVTVRLLSVPEEMRRALEVQDAVFGGVPRAEWLVSELLERQANGEGVELWAAECDGRFVSSGRMEPVAGTAFAACGAVSRCLSIGAAASTALWSRRVRARPWPGAFAGCIRIPPRSLAPSSSGRGWSR